MNWLVYYPDDFCNEVKFVRKVMRYISPQDVIFYLYDAQRLTARLPHLALKLNISELKIINRALVFDDCHQNTKNLIQKLRQLDISGRLIRVVMTRVVNISDANFDVYIGRGSYWGNPHAIGAANSLDEQPNDRMEAIRKFQYDFDRNLLRDGPAFKHKLMQLKGLTLGCHCKPFVCHGDILATYLNALDDGR